MVDLKRARITGVTLDRRFVKVAERHVAMAQIRCPECDGVFAGTTFDTTAGGAMWRATCPRLHNWDVYPEQEN